ncbi:hypothetical protein A7Q09_01570 [Methylacidiphilum sp. Yel]|uniref:AbrB/MazE/SpoVT family DNA-binding domain-containing protein n=1 Tax=Methylacidiphilum sp. Yel TaxID=1847730 RepID=UPI001068E375|nr:hypothetical protein A7Q09_01570 [Methylacidiphilum sp. Yel]
MEVVAKVTAKGQTTIPKEVRETLKIGPGDRIVWEVADGKAVVRRAEPLDLRSLDLQSSCLRNK